MHHQRFDLKISVDVQLLTLNFNGVAGQGNASFDEIATGVLRELEYDDITALWRTVGKDPVENRVGIAREDELVDDQVVADEEIVLSCGESSITLTRAGKILIRGKYVLSRSSGVNRIKGGSIQLN